MRTKEGGFTLIELMVSLAVLSILALGFFELFNALLNSAFLAQKEATALTLANTQMEYLKSLPYSELAVAGGPIISSQTIPGTIYKTVNGHQYIITTTIVYVDDAYDGCGSYPSLALEKIYCRNYPPPANAPTTNVDTADYKDVRVAVSDSVTGSVLATLDTYIAPNVYGNTGNNGTLFVKVIDNNGNPVSGATVEVTNNSLDPTVSVGSTTDSNGMALFYNLPPDNKYDYVISASDANYSTLTTIGAQGSLEPNYPNQKLINQSSSLATLMIEPQGQYSLLMQTTDVNGNPIPGVKVYVKGGYKDYTSSSNTQYYYDTIAQNDSPVTDSNGMAGLTNLVPGSYIFCGDTGSTGCSVGGTTYYLAAAVPYGGNNPLNPIVVPTYLASNPPSTTYSYNGNSYLQEVRLMLTTSSTFPRINSITPYSVSLSTSNLSDFSFTLNGQNLPCSASSTNCSTTVSFKQGSTSFPASCTGSGAGLVLNCTVNLSNVTTGNTQLVVSSNGSTLTLPPSPLIGGLIIDQ
jgi:prepilin-type N-terminal cleavage/methylation domain-containing protein